MFVGHLAVALAAKPASPRVSLGILIGAAFGLDLLWPVLLLLGAEQVSVQPGITAFTPLNFERYPWSHSLLMAVVWGAVLAMLVRPSQARARWVIGGLVSRSTTRRDGESRWALPSLLFFTIVIWASGPFSPPPPGATAIAIVGLAMWLFPLWGHWIERTRDVRPGK
ncbi:MAG: hypothetical protein AB7K63_08895 [Vicinamibacterales bacterium]